MVEGFYIINKNRFDIDFSPLDFVMIPCSLTTLIA